MNISPDVCWQHIASEPFWTIRPKRAIHAWGAHSVGPTESTPEFTIPLSPLVLLPSVITPCYDTSQNQELEKESEPSAF